MRIPPVDVEDLHERLSGDVVCRGPRQVDSNPVSIEVSRFHHAQSRTQVTCSHRPDGPREARPRARATWTSRPRTRGRAHICNARLARGVRRQPDDEILTRSRIRGAVANTRCGLMPVISTRMPLHTSLHALCSLVTLTGRQRSANSVVRRSCPTVTRRARARASSQLARPKRPKRPPWPVA